jgi:preprotein translocase subunit SecE
MAKTSPAQFIDQVRQEARKVTWTTRSETMVTTVMVFIMVALAAVFFTIIDQGLSFIIRTLLSFGG